MFVSVNFATGENHAEGADSCDSVLLSVRIFSFGHTERLFSLFAVRRPAFKAWFPFTPKVPRHLFCVSLEAHGLADLWIPDVNEWLVAIHTEDTHSKP